MIYQIIRGILGPHGRWILDFIVEHQLIIFSVIFTVFLIRELRAEPDSRTGWHLDLKLKEKLKQRKRSGEDEVSSN